MAIVDAVAYFANPAHSYMIIVDEEGDEVVAGGVKYPAYYIGVDTTIKDAGEVLNRAAIARKAKEAKAQKKAEREREINLRMQAYDEREREACVAYLLWLAENDVPDENLQKEVTLRYVSDWLNADIATTRAELYQDSVYCIRANPWISDRSDDRYTQHAILWWYFRKNVFEGERPYSYYFPMHHFTQIKEATRCTASSTDGTLGV